MTNYRGQKEKFICAFGPQNRTKNVNNTVETFELFLMRKTVQKIVEEIKHYAEQVQNSRGHLFPRRFIQSKQ
jgi:hypothetical protein